MQTSMAVFLACTVIYFGAVVMPVPEAQSAVGWLSQVVVATGAFATFASMASHRLSVTQALAVFLCAGGLAAVSSLATTACYLKDSQCTSLFPLHATIFSSAFLAGSAAFTSFAAWTALGLPLWAVIVGTVLAAPGLVVVVMPFVSRFVGAAFGQLAS